MKKNYKIGDKIIIKKKPTHWSSCCSTKSPIDNGHLDKPVSYPYKCTIIKLEQSDYHLAMMDDNGYGWSIDTLVNQNCIDNIKEERRDKLKKINNNY